MTWDLEGVVFDRPDPLSYVYSQAIRFDPGGPGRLGPCDFSLDSQGGAQEAQGSSVALDVLLVLG